MKSLCLSIVVVAFALISGCGAKDDSQGRAALNSKQIVLKYDGDLEESSHFRISLPVWSAVTGGESELDSATGEYRGTILGLQTGEYLVAAVRQTELKEHWDGMLEALAVARTLKGARVFKEGDDEYIAEFSSATFGGTTRSSVSAHRVNDVKKELITVSFHSSEGEQFTDRHVEELLASVKGAKVGSSKAE